MQGERLTSWAVTQDGQRVRLGFEDDRGESCGISLPVELLSALMMTIPRMLRQALESQFADGSLRMVHELGDWRLEQATGHDSFILSLSTPDGFEVAFVVPSSAADALAKTLDQCTQTQLASVASLN